MCLLHGVYVAISRRRRRVHFYKLPMLFTIVTLTLMSFAKESNEALPEEIVSPFFVNCSSLLRGQYSCPLPIIEPLTQQPQGCRKDRTAPLVCTLNPGLVCLNGTQGFTDHQVMSKNSSLSVGTQYLFNSNLQPNQFVYDTPCLWTNGYSFETSLLLSIFLGMFGADRFYLGYPGIGLLKFCTLGFLFFGQLVDIVLIAMQVVKPSDGSDYVIKSFGPRLRILSTDNHTFILPNDEL